jgi:hypothetical protein
MEINKLVLNGIEYTITDKQAQSILLVLKEDVDTLKNNVDTLSDDVSALDKKVDDNIGKLFLIDV